MAQPTLEVLCVLYALWVGGSGACATFHWTEQQVATANYRHAAPVTRPMHRRNTVE